MSLESMNIRNIFIKGLQYLFKEGYNAQKVAQYAFEFFLYRDMSDDKELEKLVDDLRYMDGDYQFEMTEQEVKELVKDKLGVDL